jgi:hypothetical protein
VESETFKHFKLEEHGAQKKREGDGKKKRGDEMRKERKKKQK